MQQFRMQVHYLLVNDTTNWNFHVGFLCISLDSLKKKNGLICSNFSLIVYQPLCEFDKALFELQV